jgi:hypothetical protein
MKIKKTLKKISKYLKDSTLYDINKGITLAAYLPKELVFDIVKKSGLSNNTDLELDNCGLYLKSDEKLYSYFIEKYSRYYDYTIVDVSFLLDNKKYKHILNKILNDFITYNSKILYQEKKKIDEKRLIKKFLKEEFKI